MTPTGTLAAGTPAGRKRNTSLSIAAAAWGSAVTLAQVDEVGETDKIIDAQKEEEDEYEKTEEHVVEWTKQWDAVRQQILNAVGDVAGEEEAEEDVEVQACRAPGAHAHANSHFRRVVERERASLLTLRREITRTVNVWTDIMTGRVDNRNAAAELEMCVSHREAPQRWRSWGGDWSLYAELGEFLDVLLQRRLYWASQPASRPSEEEQEEENNLEESAPPSGGSHSVMRWRGPSSRHVWWGALSRPAALLGAVVVDSGHGWELGGLGDVVARVWDNASRERGNNKEAAKHEGCDLEQGAVVVEGLWLYGCQWDGQRVVDDTAAFHYWHSAGSRGDGSSSENWANGRVRAPNVLLRRRHEDDGVSKATPPHFVMAPLYAHRGSAVLVRVPLPLGDGETHAPAFWALRGVKMLVQ